MLRQSSMNLQVVDSEGGNSMAVIIVSDLPSEVTPADYGRIGELVQREGAPDGLLFHSGFVVGDHIHVVDAWESRSHYDAFRDSRLLPALLFVMGDRLSRAGTPPPPAQHEPLDLLRP